MIVSPEFANTQFFKPEVLSLMKIFSSFVNGRAIETWPQRLHWTLGMPFDVGEEGPSISKITNIIHSNRITMTY